MIPIVIFFALFAKALEIARLVAVPLAETLFADAIGNVTVSNLLAFCLLVFVCFLAGLAAKTVIARKSIAMLEDRLLTKVPIYDTVKNKLLAALSSPEGETMHPVLAKFDDAWQIAFEVERLSGGTVVVYLPGAPDPWSGSVSIMAEDRIQALDTNLASVLRILKRLGKGSDEELRGYFTDK